jgi:hypothetical protein
MQPNYQGLTVALHRALRESTQPAKLAEIVTRKQFEEPNVKPRKT